MSMPVPGCLPREVPPEGVNVGGAFLPGGVSDEVYEVHIQENFRQLNRFQTVVSMSHISIQMNENIFPSPEKFIPDRWLGDEGSSLERWNVAFSKGPRQCIGMKYVEFLLAMIPILSPSPLLPRIYFAEGCCSYSLARKIYPG